MTVSLQRWLRVKENASKLSQPEQWSNNCTQTASGIYVLSNWERQSSAYNTWWYFRCWTEWELIPTITTAQEGYSILTLSRKWRSKNHKVTKIQRKTTLNITWLVANYFTENVRGSQWACNLVNWNYIFNDF